MSVEDVLVTATFNFLLILIALVWPDRMRRALRVLKDRGERSPDRPPSPRARRRYKKRKRRPKPKPRGRDPPSNQEPGGEPGNGT